MRLLKRGRGTQKRIKTRTRRRAKSSILQHTMVQAALVLAMGSTLAFILVLRPSSRPEAPADLAVGEPAPYEIRASHNFTVVRVDTTELERRRREAENQVLPVWDFDAGRADLVVGHIENTFALMRRHLKLVAEERLLELEDAERPSPSGDGAIPDILTGDRMPPAPTEPLPPPPSEGLEGGGVREGEPPLVGDANGEERVATDRPSAEGSGDFMTDATSLGTGLLPPSELATGARENQADQSEPQNNALALLSEEERIRIMMAHRDELISGLQAGLDLQTINDLARDGFSTDTEVALKLLVAQVLSRPLVHSKEVLLAQTGMGITLRTQNAGRTVQETARRSFGDFIDQNEVPGRLQELVRTQLPADIDETRREAILATAIELVSVNINTRFNPSETDSRRLQARAAVQPETDLTHYQGGDVLLHQGDMVSVADREAIDIMRSISARSPELHANEVMIGSLIYVLLVLIGVMAYAFRFIRHFNPTLKDLTCLTVTLLFMVAITKLIIMLAAIIGDKFPDFPLVAIYTAIPFAAGAMLIRVVLNAESSLIFTIVYSLLVAIMLPEYPIFGGYALLGSLAGMGAVERAPSRMHFFKAGLLVSLVNLTFGIALILLHSVLISWSSLWILGLCLFSGLAVAILVTALLPLLESTFHYITDIKLLELSNPNHPALRELLVRAPGSYHHSMLVGNLVEAACDAIGANSLLGRVGAYYHDIGKAKNPQYFAENQSKGNPHDKLKPNMSALVIKSHIKDGLDIALSHNLPKEIVQFIEEHQGTGLISYFYHKAKEQEDPEHDEVHEKDFRYPGPKPQIAETAICMLADRIEAAARALSEPTPARLQGLVQKMINAAFTDGQLDECDLTLRDLDNIAREMIRILVSIYHQRPEYPKERQTTTGKTQAVTAKESSNGGGDKDSVDNGEARTEPEKDTTTNATALKRLGIDQSRAVDPSHRRSRD